MNYFNWNGIHLFGAEQKAETLKSKIEFGIFVPWRPWSCNDHGGWCLANTGVFSMTYLVNIDKLINSYLYLENY